MDESVFYISQGDPADKSSQSSLAHASSIHTSHHHISFRQADSPSNGAYLTGFGPGERLFTCSATKALITVYSWGKEAPEQRIPIPEALSCLTVIDHPQTGKFSTVPRFRIPWLLAGGSKTGKIYIWELSSGDLVCVKEGHYQGITNIRFDRGGSFLVTSGQDGRCIVWNTADLVKKVKSEDGGVKPFYQITDNTLPITDMVISGGGNDLRLYTCSKDNTVRVYDIMTKQLLTTFILSNPVDSLTLDPANRAIYAGLENGQIRSIPLYNINPNTGVLESIGGMNKIITVENDPNLKHTFVQHRSDEEGSMISVTKLSISLDGTSIISGDSKGRVFVSDIVTKQVIKAFTPCPNNSPISYLAVATIPGDSATGLGAKNLDKKHRMIPQFKRVLASNDPVDHQLFLDIPGDVQQGEDDSFENWLKEKQNEELEFRNLSGVASTVKQLGGTTSSGDNSKVVDLEEKLKKVADAYSELRNKHELLIKDHAKLLDSIDSKE
ncbi:IPI3 [[Candida] subhashii]|uniref:Pre-rRNA-processing protein IPI3 n=1 Tax=[Candida] subhashii TaxID=561895 RepID=A0A8J5UQ48_9ASCO|nr:IPI3 [[Candida] subhashii]KAG7664486.1 IPI3 [[Candida] subhashii]